LLGGDEGLFGLRRPPCGLIRGRITPGRCGGACPVL